MKDMDKNKFLPLQFVPSKKTREADKFYLFCFLSSPTSVKAGNQEEVIHQIRMKGIS